MYTKPEATNKESQRRLGVTTSSNNNKVTYYEVHDLYFAMSQGILQIGLRLDIGNYGEHLGLKTVFKYEIETGHSL